MNSIISPINIKGTIIITADNTLYNTILNDFIGKLFNMLIELLSRDIIELVIEVINDAKPIKANIITGI